MTRRIRLVAFAAAALLGVAVPAASAREAIVGGTPAAPGSWPSIVAIVLADEPNPALGQFCGGTLIDPAWVITAAHCLDNPAGGTFTPADIDIIAGISDLANPAGSVRVGLAGFSISPTADVAMLQLATALPAVPTMDIANPLQFALWGAGTSGRVAGWGSTSTQPPYTYPNQLQEATVTQFADATCSAVRPWGPFFAPAVEFCADNAAFGQDPCVGDSGGPLTVNDATGRRLLAGLVSYGAPTACGDTPVVYARLGDPEVYNWVHQTVLGRLAAGAVTSVRDAPRERSTSLTWTAPAATGASPILGYLVDARQKIGEPSSARGPLIRFAVPAATPALVGPLEKGAHEITIRAVTSAGAGAGTTTTAGVFGSAPRFTQAPSVSGLHLRVGRAVSIQVGSWSFVEGPQPQVSVSGSLQECAPAESSCLDLPGANQSQAFVIPDALAGKRLRARVRVVAPVHAGGEAYSDLSAVIAPSLARRGSLSVTRRAVIRGRLATQVGTNLSIQVLDRRGRKLVLSRARSTVDGRIPKARSRSRTLTGVVRGVPRGRATPAIAIALAKRTGRVQKGTLVIQATINGSAVTELRLPVTIPA